MSTLQKIKDIEDEMNRTQKNKATAHHLGMLKAKMAKLKRELLQLGPRGGGGGSAEPGFDVAKSGDARIGLIGFPSVGKSTLLNKMTSARSEVAAYEFTTLTCVPGTFAYKGAKFQLLDLPGIIEGAKDGKGRGKQVIAVARTCSVIWMVLDATRSLNFKRILERECEGFGIRLNKSPPDISIRQKDKGGLSMTSTVTLTNLDFETVKAVLTEYKMLNVDICFKCDATVDELIDIIEGNRIYIPCLYVFNKIDEVSYEELQLLSKIPNSVMISGNKRWNLDELQARSFEILNLVRVYTKPKGSTPDFDEPIIMRKGRQSLESVCKKIHKQLAAEMTGALVWGLSVKHAPQRVGREHVLEDEDVVQILRKI
nr:developmentally-regulated GTP-binding DRG-1 [Andalucia godoyi]|eukprot:ANDGO_06083.mRNA.1 Developmentally-regulated G-protein 3